MGRVWIKKAFCQVYCCAKKTTFFRSTMAAALNESFLYIFDSSVFWYLSFVTRGRAQITLTGNEFRYIFSLHRFGYLHTYPLFIIQNLANEYKLYFCFFLGFFFQNYSCTVKFVSLSQQMLYLSFTLTVKCYFEIKNKQASQLTSFVHCVSNIGLKCFEDIVNVF